MILEGKLHLVHENHHSITLQKFEQDSFLGEWNTKSYGKVTDFNLMMDKDTYGDIEYINLEEEKIIYKENEETCNIVEVIYCVNGSINISVEENIEKLIAGDVAIVKGNLEIKLLNTENINSNVVRTKVIY